MFGFLKKKEVVKKVERKRVSKNKLKYDYQDKYDFAKNIVLYQNFPTKQALSKINPKIKKSTARTYFGNAKKYIETGIINKGCDSFCKIIDEVLKTENIQPLPVPKRLQNKHKKTESIIAHISNSIYFGVMEGKNIRKCNSEAEAKLYLGCMKYINKDACIVKMLIEPIQ